MHFSHKNVTVPTVKRMKFQIVCDSSADLPQSYVSDAQVRVVPFYVSLDGQSYLKEGVELSIPQFYQAMVDHPDCFPKTSMPSIQDYIDAFMPSVQQGMPVLCICLTKLFSGSVQSACNARAAVLEEYPDARIHVMDSMLVTELEGLFVKEAVRLRDLDLELETAVSLLEEIRSSGVIFFTTKDLKYLQHGGRIGKVAQLAGSMLNLKPVLFFTNGALSNTEICRGRRRSLQKIVERFIKYLKSNSINLKDYYFATGIGLDVPEYDEFQKTLQFAFDQVGILPECWERMRIGATIGVHTGPYPMGLGILKKCSI